MGSPSAKLSAVKRALLAQQIRARSRGDEILKSEPIAIVGIGCRFPGGANNAQQLWRLLVGGVDAITEVPESRWSLRDYYAADGDAPGKMNTRWGGFLEDIDGFDADFFGISPVEAEVLDPQQRLLLEVAYEAIEDAGQVVRGTRTGVFIGISTTDYSWLQLERKQPIGPYTSTGFSHSIAANRLSYALDLRGPSVAVDTACSSSLLAVHLACQSLRQGESDMALAGGVNLMLSPVLSISFSKFGMMAPDGRCKTFDARANGFVRGEGCGVVALKRLSDALAQRDDIVALIRGSATNQDGRSNGLTAPSVLAQREVIRAALDNACVDPSQIGYIEAHGTGTALGDPIEIDAIKQIYGASAARPAPQTTYLGSIKTNIGHLEAAAGVASLIKAALCLEQRHIPRSLHLRELNPNIELDGTSLAVASEPVEWSEGPTPRLAATSSFGFGGTNVHAILEEAPRVRTTDPREDQASAHLLPLSARSEGGLHAVVEGFAAFLEAPQPDSGASVRALCHTASVLRDHHSHRIAVVGRSRSDLASKLRNKLEPGTVLHDRAHDHRAQRLVFVFGGHGSQGDGLDAALFDGEAVFRDTLAQCDALVQQHAGWSVVTELSAKGTDSRLGETQYAQPAIFSLQVALAALWRSWGITPDAVVGHSVGEVAAAHVAGALTLEDAIRLVCVRGQLMQKTNSQGRMLAVALSEPRVQRALSCDTRLCVAAVNGPSSTVVAGDAGPLGELASRLAADGVHTTTLGVNRAFHSPHMDPVMQDLRRALQWLEPAHASVPMVSTVTGEACPGSQLEADYWVDNMRRPVRFATAIDELGRDGLGLFLEVGGHPVLAKAITDTLARANARGLAMPSHRRGNDGRSVMLSSLAQLYRVGRPIHWRGLFGPGTKRARLPSYPWQRQRHWIHEKNTMSTEHSPTVSEVPPTSPTRAGNKPIVLGFLRATFAQLVGKAESEVDVHTPFLSMGSDSLMLTNLARAIATQFGVTVATRILFEETATLDSLSNFVHNSLPPDWAPPARVAATTVRDAPSPPPPAAITVPPPSSGSGIEAVVHRQLDLMAAQLRAMQGETLASDRPAAPTPVAPAPAAGVDPPPERGAQRPIAQAIGPYRPLAPHATGTSTTRQQDHLAELIERYTARTRTSKAIATSNRKQLADGRAWAGFRYSLKELSYPIVTTRSLGAQLWDVDGNAYVDFGMGFGVNLFGHNPAFIRDAIEHQLQAGIEIGTQSPLVGEVADLFCRATGAERVAFCNTGTEAVMGAIRLARKATGRPKIAVFKGSYHGLYDGVLGYAAGMGSTSETLPAIPGVEQNAVRDTLVLEYGATSSLELLQQHASQLAAIVVEPVQSRRPGFQPAAFLQDLRQWTESHDVALLFDEVITGFRIGPGGCQEHFGIKADLATYGKVLGGGLPIGAVAGKARFLDGVDGGPWTFGDDSYPRIEPTMFGGTFQKHPLALAAARAVLQRILGEGPELYRRLNEGTARLAARLNAFFQDGAFPYQVANFGSLFRFYCDGSHNLNQPLKLELLYYHLIDRGFHIWEGRNCFLSDAHTIEQLDAFVDAVGQSATALRKGGFTSLGPEADAARASAGPPSTTTDHATPGRAASEEPSTDATTTVDTPEQILPLTDAQRQLWLMAQRSEQLSIAYNESLTLELEGPLSLASMRDALATLVARHEALRTAIHPRGDGQSIVAAAPLDVPLLDLTVPDPKAAPGRLSALIEAESKKPFDLSQAPLVRACIAKTAEHRHTLILTTHHIVVDGWSIGILLQELTRSYNHTLEGGQELPPVPQFRDVVAWQQTSSTEPQAATDEAYWLDRLAEQTPAELPADRPRKAERTHHGARRSVCLDGELARALKEFSARTGRTSFITLFGAYCFLLHRFSGRSELVVGTGVARRLWPDSEAVVGYCADLAPIQSHIESNPTVSEHIGKIRDVVLDAFDHQQIPVSTVFTRYLEQNPGAHSSLVSAIFNMDRPMTPPRLTGLKTTLRLPPLSFVKFDFALNVLDLDGELRLDLDYDTDLYDPSTIDDFLECYTDLVRDLVAGEQPHLADLCLLPRSQRRRVLQQWNQTEREFDRNRCIHTQFEDVARRLPDTAAVRFEGAQLSYQQLNCRANQLARHLIELGVGPDVLVAMYLPRSLDAVVAMLGIWKAGGAYLPLDPAHMKQRLSFVLDDAATKIVVTHSGCRDDIPPSDDRSLVALDSDWDRISQHNGEDLQRPVHSSNLAYAIYTSGSTGTPKGVLIQHEGVVNLGQAQVRAFEIPVASPVLQFSSLSFDASVFEFMMALGVGGTLCLYDSASQRTPRPLASMLREEGIVAAVMPPSVLDTLPPDEFPALEVVISAGEACSRDLADRWSTGRRFYNAYGPTETTVWATLERCTQEAGTPSIGQPIDNTRAYLLDEYLQPVRIGAPGELYIGGVSLARGLLGRPGATAERFIPDPFSRTGEGERLYRTGDFARFLPNGRLHYLGRRDHQVKLRGFRIEIGEIEAVLGRHPGIRQCVVTTWGDEGKPQSLAAYIVPQPDASPSPDELRSYAAQTLPDYMVPAAYVTTQQLPMTANGKVDRKALRPADDVRAQGRLSTSTPRSPLEQLVASTFCEVLRLDSCGLHDNFFAIGGHSLMATQIVARLQEAFGMTVPVRCLFEAPTVSALAARIGAELRASPSAAPPRIVPDSRARQRTVSFAQERLLFQEQLVGPSPAYNMTTTWRLEGPLDIDQLEHTLFELVRRHDVLRATFRFEDGVAIQEISEPQPLALPIVDLRSTAEAGRDDQMRQLAATQAVGVFDLATGPLVRASLIRLEEQTHVLVVTMHHLVSDGWSLNILVDSLAISYAALVSGRPPPLPDLPIQYSDFASWQRQWLSGEVLEGQLAYWRRQLADTPVLELPTNRPRPDRQSYEGAAIPFVLHAQTVSGLKRLTAESNATTYMAMLAAFAAVLSRYARQEDIAIGSSIANRSQKQLESLIGFFVNTLVMRIDLSANPTFRELLARVKRVALEGYAHQDLPFERLIQELRPARSLDRNALFQVMLVFQDMPEPREGIAGLTLRPVELDAGWVVRSDLDFYVWEEETTIRGYFVYNKALFDADTIETMVGRMTTIIEGAVADPDRPLDALQFRQPRGLPALRPIVEESTLAPLSYHQERLWFIDEFEAGNVYEQNPTYHNFPLILHFDGEVDVSRLQQSLEVLLRRHSVLRTRFVREGTAPRQQVMPVDQAEASLRIVRHPDAGDLEGAWAHALELNRRPFVLDRDLPLRADWVPFDGTQSLFLLSVHHIAADRASLSLIATELAEIYSARVEGRQPRLDETPLQYVEYTTWQRNLPSTALEPLLMYWKWQLRGHLQALELPTKCPRHPIHVYEGRRVPIAIPQDLAEGVYRLARTEHTEVFTLLLAAFAALLHRYTGNSEVVIGISDDNRELAGSSGVVGPVSNLLPIRITPGGHTARSILAQVGETLEQARQHHGLPFDELVRQLRLPKDMSRTALFDTLFQFEEGNPRACSFGSTRAEVNTGDFGDGKYDLNLRLGGSAGGLAGSLVYNAELYDDAFVRGLGDAFELVLRALVADPEASLAAFDIVSEADKRNQLVTWNDTDASFPDHKTIHELFEERARAHPDDVALSCGDRSLTYRELDERSNQLAHHLVDHGVGADSLVGVCLHRSIETVVTLLGVLKAGGAYLPVDATYPRTRIELMLEAAAASYLVTSRCALEGDVSSVDVVFRLDDDAEAIAEQPTTTLSVTVGSRNLAYCLFTSGSTGRPKGVLIEHQNVVRLMLGEAMPFRFTRDDVWTMFHSYCFDFSVWEMYGALLHGGRLVIVPKSVSRDPKLFADLLVAERVTVLSQVPGSFYNLMDELLDRSADLRLRYVIFGGEALQPARLQRFRDARPTTSLVNMYGITETTVHNTYKVLSASEIETNSSNIGRPIPTTRIYIMDSNLRLLPVGVPGEICVAGRGLARSYLGHEETTRARFVENPYRPGERIYRSGDLGYHLPAGEVIYLGRKDDQVKIRGFRVEPGEIRAHLLRHEGVDAAEVTARIAKSGERELVAYVVPRGDATLDQLRQTLRQTLPDFMVPSAFVELERLPLTATGKVDHSALPAPGTDARRTDTERVAPRTPEEQLLVDIWKELLDLSEVGIDDDFFDLGGHSLLGAQLSARVARAFDIKVPLRELFDAPTIRQFAAVVVRMKQSAKPASKIVPVPRRRVTSSTLASSQAPRTTSSEPDSGQ